MLLSVISAVVAVTIATPGKKVVGHIVGRLAFIVSIMDRARRLRVVAEA